jgi:hypothetical protein
MMEQSMSLSNNKRLIPIVFLNLFLIALAVMFFFYANPWIHNYYNAKLKELPDNLRGYPYYFSSDVNKAKTTLEFIFIAVMILISGLTFFLEIRLSGWTRYLFFALTVCIGIAIILGMAIRLFLTTSILS